MHHAPLVAHTFEHGEVREELERGEVFVDSEILRQVTPALAKFLDGAFDETAEAYKTEIKKLTVGANI